MKSPKLLNFNDPELIAALEFYLQNQGWTQTDLARGTGINTSTISDWIHGKYGPGSEGLRGLCKIFEVSRSEFWAKGEEIVDRLRREETERLGQQQLRMARLVESLADLDPESREEVYEMVALKTKSVAGT